MKLSALIKTRTRIAIAALLVVLLASLAWCAYAYAEHRDDEDLTASRSQAVTTALASVPKLLTYRASSIDADFRAAYPLLTGPFRQQFTELATRTIIPQARDAGIQTTAKVVASGVTNSAESTAELLLFVDQTTTSKDSPDTRVEGSRVRVTMQRSDGTWKVSGMTPV